MSNEQDGRLAQNVDDVIDIWESVLDRVSPLPPEKRPLWREAARRSVTPEALAQFQQMSRKEIATMIADVLSDTLHAEARATREGGSP